MKPAGKSGYLLLNKQPGLSSFESLRPVKKAFSTGKVCHTGTLDTFARGLLVILVGRAVKLASWFSGCDKRYRAALKFGEETDTLDPEGRIVAEAPPPGREDLEGVLPSFTGEILQAPPEYSAVHVNGRRAHELARRGIAVEMKKRKVTIYDLRLLKWDPPFAEIEVFCSKGTYIRSLARDIALALSSRAHLVSLTRTVVGGFSLEKALTLDGPEGLEGELKPIDRELFSLLGIPGLIIDRETASSVARGFPLRYLAERLPLPEGALSAALFGPSEDSEPYFAGIIEKRGGLWKYGYVNADP